MKHFALLRSGILQGLLLEPAFLGRLALRPKECLACFCISPRLFQLIPILRDPVVVRGWSVVPRRSGHRPTVLLAIRESSQDRLARRLLPENLGAPGLRLRLPLP